jgi:hypothetical protein
MSEESRVQPLREGHVAVKLHAAESVAVQLAHGVAYTSLLAVVSAQRFKHGLSPPLFCRG